MSDPSETADQSSTKQRHLLDPHRVHLRGSGLTDATINAAGIYSVDGAAEAAHLLKWTGKSGPAPAIAFPVYDFEGAVVQTVLRPDTPFARKDGSKAKYEQPLGESHRVWFPPQPLVVHGRLLDRAQPLIFTEGIKKALVAIQAGAVAISMQGVSTWHDAEHRREVGKGAPDEWKLREDLGPLLPTLSGRVIYVVFDGGDTTSNEAVVLAEARLTRMLVDAGAAVWLVRVPVVVPGLKVGLDDHLAQIPDVDRGSALDKLYAGAMPGDPLARVRALATAGDKEAVAIALTRDLSFCAAVSIADAATVDVLAAELKHIAHIGRKALLASVENFRARFTPKTDPVGPPTDAEPDVGPQETGALLDAVQAAIARHVWLPSHAPNVAIALWILHTWAIDAADYTARLIVRSPAQRCGKSLLLEILLALCRGPLITANASAAAVYRAIDEDQPTLLVDEADTFLDLHEDLRGVLNAGYSRATGFALRCEKFETDQGSVVKPVNFACFCPVAVAAIGHLPSTIEDRGILVAMQRKVKGTKVSRFRRRERAALVPLKRRLDRWARDHVDALKSAVPTLPPELNDRLSDVWEPLLAIADLAGGDWSSKARGAAVELTGAVEAEGVTDTRLRLLAAIRTVYEPAALEQGADRPSPWERLSLATIVETLVSDETAGWGEVNRGKPITPAYVGRVLRDFGAGMAQQWRPGEGEPDAARGNRCRGYYRDRLAPIWAQYLDQPPSSPPPPDTPEAPPCDGATDQQSQGESHGSAGVTDHDRHGSETAGKSNGENGCHAVTHENGGGHPDQRESECGGEAQTDEPDGVPL
jgi:hypothetical protein